MRRVVFAGLITVAIAVTVLYVTPLVKPKPLDAFGYNELLGRGINLGNALEAPVEGAWGIRLEEEYFSLIAEAGFDSVRIPIRWSARALKEPPYTIDEEFFARVDWAVAQATDNSLATIINMHHYDEIFQEPEQHRERFLAMWHQIASHYQDAPETVSFEFLNEPHAALTHTIWNELAAETLALVRQTNPTRVVIIGPTSWNGIDDLPKLAVPDDPYLIVTVHYYSPFQFTHQGAEWVSGSHPWLGREWPGSPIAPQMIEMDFEKAATWAKEQGVPLFLGEFGAYSKADMDSRARWTTHVVEAAETQGMSWAYWEFGSGFGAYDRIYGKWNEQLLGALVQ